MSEPITLALPEPPSANRKRDQTPLQMARRKAAEESRARFRVLCLQHGIPAPDTEWRFHETRQWRFDFAWPAYKVALEVEGGVFGKAGSRHTRGAGFRADLEKYNTATVYGWRVLRVLTEQRDDLTTIGMLQALLTVRGVERA